MRSLFIAATAFFVTMGGAALYSAFAPPVAPQEMVVSLAITPSEQPAAPPQDLLPPALAPASGDSVGSDQAPEDEADTAEAAEIAPDAGLSREDRKRLSSLDPASLPDVTSSTGSAATQEQSAAIETASPELASDPAGAAVETTPPAEEPFAAPSEETPPDQQTALGEPDAPAQYPATEAAESAEPVVAVERAPAVPLPTRAPPPPPSAQKLAALDPANIAAVPPGPKVSLLLRGLGHSPALNEAALGGVPREVALGVLPFSAGSQALAETARAQGHEVLVQLPLEPKNYPETSAGPESMLTTLTPEENLKRLDQVLARFQGVTGATNLLGGKMLQSPDALRPLLSALADRGMLYVGETSGPQSVVKNTAKSVALPYGGANVFIDGRGEAEAIDAQLAKLASVAKVRGTALAIVQATPVTIARIAAWSQTLADAGVSLVPVTVLAER